MFNFSPSYASTCLLTQAENATGRVHLKYSCTFVMVNVAKPESIIILIYRWVWEICEMTNQTSYCCSRQKSAPRTKVLANFWLNPFLQQKGNTQLCIHYRLSGAGALACIVPSPSKLSTRNTSFRKKHASYTSPRILQPLFADTFSRSEINIILQGVSDRTER